MNDTMSPAMQNYDKVSASTITTTPNVTKENTVIHPRLPSADKAQPWSTNESASKESSAALTRHISMGAEPSTGELEKGINDTAVEHDVMSREKLPSTPRLETDPGMLAETGVAKPRPISFEPHDGSVLSLKVHVW